MHCTSKSLFRPTSLRVLEESLDGGHSGPRDPGTCIGPQPRSERGVGCLSGAARRLGEGGGRSLSPRSFLRGLLRLTKMCVYESFLQLVPLLGLWVVEELFIGFKGVLGRSKASLVECGR